MTDRPYERLNGYDVGFHSATNYIFRQILDTMPSEDSEEILKFLAEFADDIEADLEGEVVDGVVDRLRLFLETYEDEDDVDNE